MANSPRCVERSVRIYQSLIKAYPPSFRKEYGDEMIGVFRDLATDAWLRRRPIGLLALWFRVIADLVRTAPKQHLSRWKTHKGGTCHGNQITAHARDFRPSDKVDIAGARLRAYGLVIRGFPLLWKFMSMALTRTAMFFGILVAVALTLQFIGFGTAASAG